MRCERRVQPTPRPGVAIGDKILDLSEIAAAGLFAGPLLKGTAHAIFSQVRCDGADLARLALAHSRSPERAGTQPTLNAFMALGRPSWREARATVQQLLSAHEPTLRDNHELRARVRELVLRMPHRLARPPSPSLLPASPH